MYKRQHDVHSAEPVALGCDEVHKLDAANAQARARVAKSAQKPAAAQQERSTMSVDLALQYRCHE